MRCAARGRDARVAGLTLGINDAINWAGQHAAGRIYVSAHRRFAVLADEAGAISMERERQSAAEAERGRQHRLLHATTVDVLRDLAQSTDEDAAAITAQREAARLRHALRSRGERRSQIGVALQAACDASAARGLDVELVTSELTADVSDAVANGLQHAVDTSLSVAREIAGARRAVVRATNDAAVISITVRHQEGGFEPGTESSHEQRLTRDRTRADRRERRSGGLVGARSRSPRDLAGAVRSAISCRTRDR